MMNRWMLWSYCLLFLLISCNSGQNHTNESISIDKELEKNPLFKTINVRQDSLWNSIKSDWQKNHYNPCLEQAEVVIGCDDCTGAYLDVILYINECGYLEKYKMEQAYFCENEDLKTCLMMSFKGIKFPKRYHQTSFQTRLGLLLKC